MINAKQSQRTPCLTHIKEFYLCHIIIYRAERCFLFGNFPEGFDHCVLQCRLDKLNQLLVEMGNSGAWISEAICKSAELARKRDFHINVKKATGQEMQYISNVIFDLIKTGEFEIDDEPTMSFFIEDIHGIA